jgi:hypothetical protein
MKGLFPGEADVRNRERHVWEPAVLAVPASVPEVESKVVRRSGRRGNRKRPSRVIGDHERDTVALQQLVHLVDIPARVPRLKGMPAGRQSLECGGQALVVPNERRRELPEDRAKLARLNEGVERLVSRTTPCSRSRRRLTWVRYLLALTAKLKPSGVVSAHACTAFVVGSR